MMSIRATLRPCSRRVQLWTEGDNAHDGAMHTPARPSDRIAALVRAASLRCPLCGSSWPRTRWIDLAGCCAACRLRLDRGERDYYLGTYTINLMFALAAAVGLAVAAILVPLPSWAIYGVGLPALAALAIGLHPVSRLLWLATDLQFRRATERDFDADASQSRLSVSGESVATLGSVPHSEES